MLKTWFSAVMVMVSLGTFAQQKTDIDRFIDGWHLAATNADAPSYFNAMDDDCIFIGTDSSERWTKTEFAKFAKPHFDKGKAWDFKAFNRDTHVSKDGKYVWFSELLTTWMGVCRGSGILYKSPKGWKFKQYHLAVTVPNDAIKDFISLVENFHKAKK